MQNLARFWMTSKFGGKYLRNEWRYSKSDSHSVYRDSKFFCQREISEMRGPIGVKFCTMVSA